MYQSQTANFTLTITQLMMLENIYDIGSSEQQCYTNTSMVLIILIIINRFV